MILGKQFEKSIPLGQKEKILNKLSRFESELLKCESKIRELPSGYWVRSIKNTDVFKFRLNNKDRILYTYRKSRSSNNKCSSEIVFLSYVTHDKQVRMSKNMDILNIKTYDFEIDNSEYIEDNDLDKYINEDISKYCKNNYIDMDLIPSVIVDMENMAEIAEEDYEDYLYYLSTEQYEIIKSLEESCLISGSGGTGKTVVLLNMLIIANEEKSKALYTTYNNLLLESIEGTYKKFINSDKEYCDFISIKNLQSDINTNKDKKIITHKEIMNWVENNIDKYKELKNRDIYEVVTELNGVIKGYLGLEFREIDELYKNNYNRISFDQYINISKQYSAFSYDEKRSMYNLVEHYEKWLEDNNFIDENDVARKIILNVESKNIYDWVIVDEVQDLSEVQIYMLSQLVKPNGYIIWSGDANQSINPIFFNYGRIKNLYYCSNKELKNFSLTKNYRSTKGIVDFINDITEEKYKLIGRDSYDNRQIAIRDGDKPNILDFNNENMDCLFKKLSDKHYSAIVVANEKVKRDIIKKYKEIESRVFLVHEIKGLEYENIICYNILSTYNEIWKKIVDGDCKKNNYMRYYFNMLYVAISRAKDNLSIYEESIDKIIFKPFENCNKLIEFDEVKLGLSKKSTDRDWKVEADRLEKTGHDEKAKLIRDYKIEGILCEINEDIDNSVSKSFDNVSKEICIKNELKCEFEKKFKEGIIKYRQRNYSDALKIFNNIYENNPEEAELNYYIANCYSYMTGGMEYSLRYFLEAIKLNPRKYEYYLDMCAILNVLGKYDEALEILNVAEKICPGYGNVYEMRANIYLNQKKYNKLSNAIKLSEKFPKYIFDSYNKCWNPPKKKKEEIKVYQKKDNSEQNTLTNIKLPDGVQYIKIGENNKIKECINNIEFKNVMFNKKTKRYLIEFEVELCEICEFYNKCIASKVDKYNKVSLKESIIKNLQKQVKIDDNNKISEGKNHICKEKVDEVINFKDINNLITNMYNKFSNIFNNEWIGLNTNKKKDNKVDINGSNNSKDSFMELIYKFNTNLVIIKYQKMSIEAFNYVNELKYDKAINIYNLLLDKYLSKKINELTNFDLEKLIKYYNVFLNVEFNSFEEIEGYFLAELYNNLGRVYLEKEQLKQAKVNLKKAIEISKKYTNSYLSLGDVYMREKNYSKALEYYDMAVSLGNPRGEIGKKYVSEELLKLYYKRN